LVFLQSHKGALSVTTSGQANTTRKLVLFIAEGAPSSVQAIANLSKARAALMPAELEIEFVNVFQHPERAVRDRILVTPTLFRFDNPFGPRLVGDLSDRETVEVFLAQALLDEPT
jgi:circadian clock protein KaiB